VRKIKRILVANRGEIALRIIRTVKEIGIDTVAIYEKPDSEAYLLRFADQAIMIGDGPRKDYLNIERIIWAAKKAGADAIHPGYGFLAENADFSAACEAAGIIFIGPPPEVIRNLGNKVIARQIMKDADIPFVPGTENLSPGEEGMAEAIRFGNQIGYPIMLKASSGGGGRGIRKVANEEELKSQLPQARAEALSAFNDDSIYIEKCVESPRHIEVQILADQHGNVMHLGTRDCSIQRRHQKMIEESPCPVLEDRDRQKLAECAIRLIKEAKYVNAATVEFLLDKDNKFYFIEVNTRIQVEHPVTEMVTGHDLIKWQIRIASGQPLKLRQKSIKHQGVAIECRINAEDPANNFSPSPGTITQFIAPGGNGVRVDTHAHQGWTVTPHYDSLIAKLIVHQKTRAEAIATMRRALQEFVIHPVKTTIPACLEILSHNLFVKGKVDTGFVERNL